MKNIDVGPQFEKTCNFLKGLGGMGGGGDFEEMMRQMGGLGAGGGEKPSFDDLEGSEGTDSDDEPIPDLE